MSKRWNLYARIIHRKRLIDRAVQFLELGIYRGDVFLVYGPDVLPVWSEVKDFKMDKYNRRWVILKNGLEVRVDPMFQVPYFWQNTSEIERLERFNRGEH